MIEIRFHGRGGQGAVTSAELVALAAIEQGRFAQSMPSFGPERRGAPVQAYLRVADEKIRVRAEINHPNIVVVLDDSLIDILDVTHGLKDKGLVVLNTRRSEKEVREVMKYKGSLACIDALTIALETLKVPITNTTMIGALLKASGVIPLDALVPQIERRFNPKLAERNVAALKRAFEETKVSG
ncbi:MAG: 2-oxoacid:acceptor oxidoreductase family protein [Proteobacteria bacterium]|nr:2-oxoacid:acceptor oxidoreductase family protein [Pseudomonadota bacterium]